MLTLTKQVIEKLECDGQKQTIFWDFNVPSFGVRVYPGGAKSFVFRYRIYGRKRLLVIASCDSMSVSTARNRAVLLQEKTDRNIDVSRENRKRYVTVSEFSEMYMERHAKVHKKSWRGDQAMIDQYINPKWSSRMFCDIQVEDVVDLHAEIGSSYPYRANRVKELLSKMFSLASVWGYTIERNPALGVQDFKETARDRWVTPEELERLSSIIAMEPEIYVRVLFHLYLLTGLRKQELLKLQWKDVNFELKEIRLIGSKTKNGKTHIEPLAEQSIQLLKTLPQIPGNAYVFPGVVSSGHGHNMTVYSETKPRNTVDKAWRRIRKEAGLDDVQIHDLRRTTGSWLAQSGHSLHMIGNVLNQSNERVTQVYAQLENKNVRAALEDLSSKLTPHFRIREAKRADSAVSMTTDDKNQIKLLLQSIHG